MQILWSWKTRWVLLLSIKRSDTRFGVKDLSRWRVGDDVWVAWSYVKDSDVRLELMFGWHEVMLKTRMKGWNLFLDDNEAMLVIGWRVGNDMDDVWMAWCYVKDPGEGLGMFGWHEVMSRARMKGWRMMFGWHEVMLRSRMKGWGWCLDDNGVTLKEWMGWGWCLDDMRLC